MTVWLLLLAAAFLSLERICYVYISRAPERFRRFCTRPAVASFGDPVDVVRKLFYGFKGIQFVMFFAWCYVHGHGLLSPATRGFLPLAIAGALILAGQILNCGGVLSIGHGGGVLRQ
jgi:hypothetical protein